MFCAFWCNRFGLVVFLECKWKKRFCFKTWLFKQFWRTLIRGKVFYQECNLIFQNGVNFILVWSNFFKRNIWLLFQRVYFKWWKGYISCELDPTRRCLGNRVPREVNSGRKGPRKNDIHPDISTPIPHRIHQP